jgi:hypothetical protein
MVELQYPPYIWPLIIAILACITLTIVVWRRRPGPGVMPFIVLMVGVIEWSVGNIFEFLMVDLSDKFVFTRLIYIGITVVTAAWLVFVLEYTGRSQWVTRRNLRLLAIEPILVQIFAWTN